MRSSLKRSSYYIGAYNVSNRFPFYRIPSATIIIYIHRILCSYNNAKHDDVIRPRNEIFKEEFYYLEILKCIDSIRIELRLRNIYI